MVGEDGAEARPRLHAGVPVLGAAVVAPGDLADVADRREFRGRHDVRARKSVAAQPASQVAQPGDVLQMLLAVGVSRPQQPPLRCAQLQYSLHYSPLRPLTPSPPLELPPTPPPQ